MVHDIAANDIDDMLIYIKSQGYNLTKNIARGILPVAATWDTDPSDLANITDGDQSTETGEGVHAFGGAANAAYITIALGRKVSGIVLVGMNAKVSASTATFYVRQYDGAAWSYGCSGIVSISDATYRNKPILPVYISNAEQIQIYFYASGALTLTAKFRDITILEVLL